MVEVEEKAIIIHNLGELRFYELDRCFFIEVATQIVVVVIVGMQIIEFSWQFGWLVVN